MRLERGGSRWKWVLEAFILLAVFSLAACGEDGKEKGNVGEETGAASSRGKAAPEVNWITSLPDGMKLAKKEKKPLMASFFSPRCGWCKVMEQKTYGNPEVVKRSSDFISVRVNVEKDYTLAAQYRVMGLPTTVFMNSEGKEIHRVVGYRDAKQYLGEMATALKKS